MTGKQPSAKEGTSKKQMFLRHETRFARVCSELTGRFYPVQRERKRQIKKGENKQSAHSGQVLVGCRPENSMMKPVAKVDQLVEFFWSGLSQILISRVYTQYMNCEGKITNT